MPNWPKMANGLCFKEKHCNCCAAVFWLLCGITGREHARGNARQDSLIPFLNPLLEELITKEITNIWVGKKKRGQGGPVIVNSNGS